METKEPTQSVIGTLMGFDELPPQQPIYKHQRVLSDDYLRKTTAIGLHLKRSFCEDRLSKKKVQKQQEFNRNNTSPLELSNVFKNEKSCKRLEKKHARENVLRSPQKLDCGSITDTRYLQNLSKLSSEIKDKIYNSPTRVVIVKPSLRKARSGIRSSYLSSYQGFHRPLERVLCNEGEAETPIRDNEIIQQIKHIIDIPYGESRPWHLNYSGDEHLQRGESTQNNVPGTPNSGLRKEAFYIDKFSMLEKAFTHTNRNGIKKERAGLRDSRFWSERSLSSSSVHIGSIYHSAKEPPLNLDSMEKKLEDIGKLVVSKYKDLDYDYLSQGIQDKPEIADVQFRKAGHSCGERQDSSIAQEKSTGSLKGGVSFSSCTQIDSELSTSCVEAYQPSPNSVLETPFTDENCEIFSSSKCFEGVKDDLYGVWMQLHLLKSEAEDTNAEEPSMLVSSDEDSTKESVDFSEENCKFTRHFRPEESRDFSYLVDVLDEANIFWNSEPKFEKLYSPEISVNPSLFGVLEKKYGKQTCWEKSERKLLFDRINSGLMEILWPYTNYNMQPKPLKTFLSASMKRNVIEEDLWVLLINQGNEVNKDLSEKAVGKEIRGLDLGDDINSIVRDIEIFLFDELIEEIV